MRANERTDERVTQYLRLDSWLIQTTVHRSLHSPDCLFSFTFFFLNEETKEAFVPDLLMDGWENVSLFIDNQEFSGPC